MTNKKIKLLFLSAALILSVNFSVFAEADLNNVEEEIQETDEIVEENSEEVLEEVEEDEKKENESQVDLIEEEEDNQEEIIETEAKDDTQSELLNEKSNEDENIQTEELDKKPKKENIAATNKNNLEVEVFTWEEFQSAYENQDVKKIIIGKDLTGPDRINYNGFEDRKNALTIDGNDHLIDVETRHYFRSDLFSLSSETSGYLRLENLSIKHRGYNIVSAEGGSELKWRVMLDNVKIPSAGQYSVVSGVGIDKVNVINNFNANIPGTSARYYVFNVPNALVEFENGSKVVIDNIVNANDIHTDRSNIILKDRAALEIANESIIKSSEVIAKNDNLNLSVFKLGRKSIIDNSSIEIDTRREGISADNLIIKNNSTIELHHSYSTASYGSLKADNILVEDSKIIADIGITLFSVKKELNVIGSDINVDTNNRIVTGKSGSKASFKKSNLKINTQTDSFYLPKIYFEDTKVNAVTNLAFFNTNSSDFSNDDLLFKVHNSEIDIVANHTSNSVIILGYGNGNRRGMHMEISGPNTLVNINSKVNSNEKGIIEMVGTNTGQGKMNGLYVESGAKLNLHSVGGHVIFSRIYEGGQTIIDGPGTELNAKQDIGNGSYLAALRYAYAGNQKLEVSNKASVNVDAGIGTSPAVRMYGNDNKFVVLSGAKMRIHNPGDGREKNPGSNGSNQGIQYQVSDQNTFTIKGSGSSLEIIADYGAAVDARTGNLDLTVGEDTIFVANGQTRDSNFSIFYAETMNFVTRSPRYYDFSNTRKSGGLVVSASSSKVSSYKSILSDFAVWKIGADINGNPHRSWSQFDFELSGSKLQEIVEPKNDPDFNSDESSFGANGLQAYTRISGNNARPIVDVFPIPFDTDRFIYGHLSVPEGLEGLRNAWTDEVFVDLEETLPNGEVKIYHDLATVGSEDGQVGYPVYDVEESSRGGYFRLDLGEGNLATIGAKYKVINAYRGYPGIAEEKKIYALEDQLGDSVVVLDKTPPVISIINSPIYNQQKIISGYSEEKDVKVSFAINKQTLLKDGKELIIHPDKNGLWELNFEDVYDLQIGDILHVILEDSVGNRNPLEDTKFHDIIKKEAAHVVIQESFFVLEAEDTFISVKDFKNIKNDDDLIRLMNASAYEKRETVVEHKVGISNRDGLSYELPRAASYTIEFSIVGHEQITLNKKLHILDYDHVEDNDEYVIVANDFYASNLDYQNKDPKTMIEKANAKAFKKDNINKEVDVLLDSGQLGPAAKEYKIVFAVKDDLSVKVNVTATVLDKQNVGETKSTVIAANNFSIMSYQVFGLSDEVIIDLSKAQAWEKDEFGVISNQVGVDIIKHNVQVEPGVYKARLKAK